MDDNINSDDDFNVDTDDDADVDSEGDDEDYESEQSEEKPKPKPKTPQELLIDNMDVILSKDRLKEAIPENGIVEDKPKEEIVPQEKMKGIIEKLKHRKVPQIRAPPPPRIVQEKEKKITLKRENEINELLMITQQLKMDSDTYNVKFFNAMSDEELMQFKMDLFKTVDQKMEVLSKDGRFISQMIIRFSQLGEKILPKYLTGYSAALKENEPDIERCLNEMIKRGEIDSILNSKLMEPKYQLMMILGGTLVKQVTDNISKAKTEVKKDIMSEIRPVIMDLKKKPELSQLQLHQPAQQSAQVFC